MDDPWGQWGPVLDAGQLLLLLAVPVGWLSWRRVLVNRPVPESDPADGRGLSGYHLALLVGGDQHLATTAMASLVDQGMLRSRHGIVELTLEGRRSSAPDPVEQLTMSIAPASMPQVSTRLRQQGVTGRLREELVARGLLVDPAATRRLAVGVVALALIPVALTTARMISSRQTGYQWGIGLVGTIGTALIVLALIGWLALTAYGALPPLRTAAGHAMIAQTRAAVLLNAADIQSTSPAGGSVMLLVALGGLEAHPDQRVAATLIKPPGSGWTSSAS